MFLVIDGSSLLVTNYYATLPPALKYEKDKKKQEALYSQIMQTESGMYTNAILGMLRTILQLIEDRFDITHVAIVFDKSRNTFRKELYSDYKSNRKQTPNPLKQQFVTAQKIFSQLGFCVLSDDNYEADDLAGSIIERFKSNNDMVFLSKDHDYLQLIDDNVVGWLPQISAEKARCIMDGHNVDCNNLPDKFAVFDEDIVLQEEGVRPSQIVDKKAICGDSSDNIPGINGVGETTVLPLLRHYENIEAIYDDIDTKDKQLLTTFWKTFLHISRPPYDKLVAGRDVAFLSKSLATIKRNVDVPSDLSSYEVHVNKDELKQIIDKYELNSLKIFL